jgi:nitrogen fixation NifU-like protein
MAGLEDLYREIILDHYRSPRNRGQLPTPPAHRVEGFNPLCGDEVVLYVDIDDSGRVTDIKVDGQGCSISQSSASMMSAAVKGRTEAETRDLIRAFKAMMSIHERGLDGGDDDAFTGGIEGDGGAVAPDPSIDMGELEALRGVVKFPVRIKCATLSWNTLAQAFDEARLERAAD